jgi:probable dihydroxyacetone kinase regulator
MRTKPLDKITVKELVEACEINRQTFYYHFQDIYDLLGWIYRTEALDSIRDNKSYDTWQQGALTILKYIQDNRELCINTYRSVAREHLEAFLHEVLYGLLSDVVDEVAGAQPLPPGSKDFVAKFYSYAFAGVLLDWINSGLKTPATTIVENIARIMDGIVPLAVRRFQQ